MGGYDRDEFEDYDDYGVEGEYRDDYMEEEEGEQEYEEEEEETRQPTQEEMEYLELRQKLKEKIRRKRIQGAAGSYQEKEKRLPYDNFGSFFGPSQPVIAQRVIQESKSLLENEHLVKQMLSSNNKKNSAPNSAGPKLGQRGQAPKPMSELKKKVEKLKNARDYSFLSDDAEPAKEAPPRNVAVPTSEARPAQMLSKSKQSSASNGNSGRNAQGIREERKAVSLNGQMQAVSLNGQMHSKDHSYKSSASKPNLMSKDSRKQPVNNGVGPGRPHGVTNGNGPDRPLGRSIGSGPGRPLGGSSGSGPGRPLSGSSGSGPGRPLGGSSGSGPGRPLGGSSGSGPGRPLGGSSGSSGPGRPLGGSNGSGAGRTTGTKAMPPKTPVPKEERKTSAPISRNLAVTSQKAPPSKMHPSDSKQRLELKREFQERNKDRIMTQRPGISTKQELRKPVKKVSSQVQRPKKKGMSEDEEALMMIRSMFRTDRYPVYDDDDDISDMEANFHDIQKEERISSKIARAEDEEQLRLIEEEERQERMMKLAKKRKLSQR